MLFYCVPLTSLAIDSVGEETEKIEVQSNEYINQEVTFEKVNDVCVREIVSMREECVKHFKLADGTYEAVVYGEPVHMMGEDGVWEDIDNGLYLTQTTKASGYATNDNRVIFAQSFSFDNELFTFNQNGYIVSMSLASDSLFNYEITSSDVVDFVKPIGAETLPTVSNASKRTNGWETLEEATRINNQSSIKYNDVLPDTDIEYIIGTSSVKENIVIKARGSSYKYTFRIDLTGLIPQMSGQTIFLVDADTKEIQYAIPQPYMYDANGEISYDISYELKEIKSGSYILQVIADDKWINSSNRIFPITVDPSFNLNSDMDDTWYWEDYPKNNYGTGLYMGVSPKATGLIRATMPNLPDGATPQISHLYLYYFSYETESSTLVGAYKVTESWNENTVTWNNRPSIDTTIQSNLRLYHQTDNTSPTSPMSVSFSITNAVADWYENPSSNYGLAIKYISGMTEMCYFRTFDYGNNLPRISISYRFQFEDGVYALKNLENGNYLSYDPSTKSMQQKTYSAQSSISALDNDNRARLFKLTHDNNTRYIVRLMYDNRLAFGVSNDGAIGMKVIPTSDDDVASADTFYIDWDGYGFVLRSYSGNYVINATSGTSLSTVNKDSAQSSARWELTKVNYDTAETGGSLYMQQAVYAGHVTDYVPWFWSTVVGAETHVYLHSGSADVITTSWNPITQKFTLTPHNPGEFQIGIQIKLDDTILFAGNVEIWDVTLLVPEGVYNFENKEFGKYMQIDNDGAPNFGVVGDIMELWDGSRQIEQAWLLKHVGDGYFTIRTIKNEMALSVQPTYIDEDAKALVQYHYSGGAHQKWKISITSSNAFALRPQSATSLDADWCMSAGSGMWQAGRNVEQREYTSNDDYKDEWLLRKIGVCSSTTIEGQEQTNWCWATSARMFAKHYYPNLTSTQSEAVSHVFGDTVNNAGTRIQAQQAIDYYISDISNASIDTVIVEGAIFSQNTLITMLNKNQVVYVSRVYCIDPTDLNTAVGGHAILVCGTVLLGNERWFIVKDPSPLDEGSIYWVSYEWLCNESNRKAGDPTDDGGARFGIWRASIVEDSQYASQTVPMVFG